MAMSSCRSWPYSPLPAYQRESQVRLIPRRRPIGLNFSPIGWLLSARLDLTNDDRQMRERLENLARAAAAAGMETLDHQALADMGLGDDQIVDAGLGVGFGIRDRRLQALADVLGDALARKFEIGERSRDLLAADELRKQVELLRGPPPPFC